jgi:hypothetical protein
MRLSAAVQGSAIGAHCGSGLAIARARVACFREKEESRRASGLPASSGADDVRGLRLAHDAGDLAALPSGASARLLFQYSEACGCLGYAGRTRERGVATPSFLLCSRTSRTLSQCRTSTKQEHKYLCVARNGRECAARSPLRRAMGRAGSQPQPTPAKTRRPARRLAFSVCGDDGWRT